MVARQVAATILSATGAARSTVYVGGVTVEDISWDAQYDKESGAGTNTGWVGK